MKKRKAQLPAPTKNRVKLEQIYKTCRLKGHHWETISLGVSYVSQGKYVSAGVVEANRCERCTTHRYYDIDTRTYDVLHRQYLYPEGYREAIAGLTARDLRRELVVEPQLKTDLPKVLDPDVIEDIKTYYSNGVTAANIAKNLNADGITNLGKRWTSSAVLNVIRETQAASS